MRTSLGWLVVALVAGALVGGGAAAWVEGDEPEDTTSPATTTAPTVDPVVVEAPWVDGGVRFRSTVLVPISFVVGDGTAELEFDLVPLHWTARHEEDELFADELPVQPEFWELTLDGGQVIEAVTTIDDAVVRFDVPVDVDAADVVSVRVTGWRLAVPVGGEMTLPVEEGAAGSFPDGSTVEIDRVLEQSTSTIVQLDSTATEAAWTGHSLAAFRTQDPGWRISFRFGQSSNVQLIWEEPGAPGEVVLIQLDPAWRPIAADVVVIGETDE